MATLPVISLWQPWASLIFAGRKKFETRSFKFPGRLTGERVGIHATAKFPPLRFISEELQKLCMDEFGCSYNYTLPQGAILGTVVLADWMKPGSERAQMLNAPSDDDRVAGDWSEGRYAWRLTDVRALPAPIPAKGKQGWWKAEIEEICPATPPRTAPGAGNDLPHTIQPPQRSCIIRGREG